MQPPDRDRSALGREEILAALNQLSQELGRRDLLGEICIFGGTAMMLAFGARLSTRDVDAVFAPSSEIRSIAASIAVDRGLPADWLNDGVKGFVSTRHQTTTGDLPQFPSLRLTMPVPEYLLAMKCMAARIGGTTGEGSDVADIRFLIRHLQLDTAQAVLDLVADFYPAERIPVKTQFLVEGLFDEGSP